MSSLAWAKVSAIRVLLFNCLTLSSNLVTFAFPLHTRYHSLPSVTLGFGTSGVTFHYVVFVHVTPVITLLFQLLLKMKQCQWEMSLALYLLWELLLLRSQQVGVASFSLSSCSIFSSTFLIYMFCSILSFKNSSPCFSFSAISLVCGSSVEESFNCFFKAAISIFLFLSISLISLQSWGSYPILTIISSKDLNLLSLAKNDRFSILSCYCTFDKPVMSLERDMAVVVIVENNISLNFLCKSILSIRCIWFTSNENMVFL